MYAFRTGIFYVTEDVIETQQESKLHVIVSRRGNTCLLMWHDWLERLTIDPVFLRSSPPLDIQCIHNMYNCC